MKLGLILAALSLPVFSQPATTTVADQFYAAVGGPTYCSGNFTLSWSTFYSTDGYLVQGGTSAAIPVSLTGTFSVNVVRTNTTTTPATGIYTVRYNLQPSTCAPAVEYWNVPNSGSPVKLVNVRTLPVPPPNLIPPSSIQPPVISGTQCLVFAGGIVGWSPSCSGGGTAVINGTARQITANTVLGTTTLSLPADLLLSGQSANGTDMLSGSRFTNTSPTGNFENFKSFSGTSLWKVDVTGTLQVGIIPVARLSTTLISSIAAVGVDTPFSFTVTNPTGGGVTTITANGGPVGQNNFWAGPSSGGSGSQGFRTIVGADLPFPSASTLGGILSLVGTSHMWINAISTSGVPSASQPAFSDLSGSATCAQLPALTGDATSSAGSCATQVVQVNGAAVPLSATLLASDASRHLIPATYQGNGAKAQLSTGSTVSGDCVKFDVNGNTIDAGAPCGSGGGGGGSSNYTQSFTSQTSVTLAHNLGSKAVLTECFDGSDNLITPIGVVNTSTTATTVTFSAAQTGYCNVNGSTTTSLYNGVDLLSANKAVLGGVTTNVAIKQATVAPSGVVDLLPTVSGVAGYVSDIWMATYQNGTINVYIDGSGSPTISVPAYSLCGDAYYTVRPAVVTPWIGSNGTGGFSGGIGCLMKLPIPFATGVHITYTNTSTSTVTYWSMISYVAGVANSWKNGENRLKIVNTSSGPDPVDTVVTMLNVSPGVPGRLAGFDAIIDSGTGSVSPATAPLEGAFKIYVDGSGTPSWTSSGTEDAVGMAGYFNGFTAPVTPGDYGLLIKTGNTWEIYRFFIKDPISFTTGLKITWAAGNSSVVNFTGNVFESYTIWYYTQ